MLARLGAEGFALVESIAAQIEAIGVIWRTLHDEQMRIVGNQENVIVADAMECELLDQASDFAIRSEWLGETLAGKDVER